MGPQQYGTTSSQNTNNEQSLNDLHRAHAAWTGCGSDAHHNGTQSVN
ncbi:MAG: hypothetical protein AB8A46_03610 [Prochlorococcus sp.]